MVNKLISRKSNITLFVSEGNFLAWSRLLVIKGAHLSLISFFYTFTITIYMFLHILVLGYSLLMLVCFIC